MMHQMRAEYGPAGSSGPVANWHIVRNDDLVAMCGRELDAAAPLQDAAHWTADPDRNCHTCGALYLRESPYLPDEHG
ncbi:hypothetical protein [Kitasatospora terrestris]